MSDGSLLVQPWRRRMAGRDPAEEHRASTPLELLFDLTFVVAVAQASAQLHHALGAGHIGHALTAYGIVFFAIWWAWMNFTWFASAYDTDDVLYRLLTLLQMGGVLVLAAGVPAGFEHFDFTVPIAGYVVMRVALVGQWLRAAREHPESRSCTLRYAVGIAVVQACWVGWLWLPGLAGQIGLPVLVAAELAVPVWAEFRGRPTSWHPGHISERYGLFTIIVLGEVVAAIAAAVQEAIAAEATSNGLLTAAAGGLALVFGLWWAYFKHSGSADISRSLYVALAWGYGHYFLFAAVAGVGAGLQVVIEALSHGAAKAPVFAAFTVAIPVAVYLLVLGLLTAPTRGETRAGAVLIAVTAVLVLLAAAGAQLLTLPVTVLVIAALVALLLAYHLTAAHRAAIR
ncbi:MAG: low temperature requirement protein A [Streptosporangiales bacterium]